MNKNKLDLKILNSEIDNIDHNSGYNLISLTIIKLQVPLAMFNRLHVK